MKDAPAELHTILMEYQAENHVKNTGFNPPKQSIR
jgi:hypothetical protein